MAMRIGFSSMTCPAWDLAGIVQAAKIMGYDGFELRGLSGEFHLPDAPELADDPDRVQRMTREAGVQLFCLGASASFESIDRKEIDGNRRQLLETIELAGWLACPHVRVFLGNSVGSEHRGTLGRVAGHLAELAAAAAEKGVCILVENGGDFLGSDDLWFLVDAVSHPAVRACLNPLNARMRAERPTTCVPRLGRRMSVFRIVDGLFSEGRFAGYAVPGKGEVELDRAIELLRGVYFDGWLSFEWPKLIADLPEPDVVLPAVAKFLREELARKQEVLTAYKGDKKAPVFKGDQAPAAAKS